MELPRRWRAYARLQEKLSRRRYVDDYTWGLEAGLNRLVAEAPPAEDVERTMRSESRKERYRARLLCVNIPIQDAARDTEADLDVDELLSRLQALVSPEDWTLLRAVGDERQYREIAAATRVAPGALRARIFRLRRLLRPIAGETLTRLTA